MDIATLSLIWKIDSNTVNVDMKIKRLLQQTYRNIEVVCCHIRDLSLKADFVKQQEIIKNWCDLNENVKYLETSQQKYIYEGIEKSTGNVFMLIHSNDLISVDYCRILMQKMETSKCDIVVGDIAVQQDLYIDQDAVIFEYSNLDPLRNDNFIFEENLWIEFLRMAPYARSWWMIEGKAISKNIYEKITLQYKPINAIYHKEFLYMLFILNASKMCNVHNSFYFSSKSTNNFTLTYADLQNRLSDLIFCLNEIDKIQKIDAVKAKKVLLLQGKILYQIALKQYSEKAIIALFNKLFSEKSNYIFSENQLYFDSIKTSIEPCFEMFEQLKTQISNFAIPYISFDIFDTLILRNLLDPVDVFILLSHRFNEVFNATTYIDFAAMRRHAENRCRDEMFRKNPSFEDITLKEIYQTIADDYILDKEKLQEVYEYEKALEIEFCIPRKAGKELYELCLHCGKKIVCITDMYLPIETIKCILEKNGYHDIEHIFLSSETRLGKYTGSIYPWILKQLKINSKEIIHIGDNWISDVVNSQKNKIQSFHLAKPLDLFRGLNKDIYMGSLYQKVFGRNGRDIDNQCAVDLFLGIRCMAALSINKFYDFPYINFNRQSDFNANPYFIGYYALGTDLWALAKWITEEAKTYKKIHFLARDGFILKQVYDIINHDNPAAPVSCYSYMSRYIIHLCDISHKDDILSLSDKMNVLAATPEKIAQLFQPVIPADKYKNLDRKMRERGVLFENKVKTHAVYLQVIQVLKESIDNEMLKEYRVKLKKYFTSIFKSGECFFDVGYNGRVEIALEKICGYPIDSFYLHSYKELMQNRQSISNFKNKCFFDWMPVSTFLLREQLMSKLDASVRGFDYCDNSLHLIFGNNEIDLHTDFITSQIQKGAMDFVRDFYNVFNDNMKFLNFRCHDAGQPLEYYFHFSTSIDRSIFKCTEYEDDFGENIRHNLADYWDENLKSYHMKTDDTYRGNLNEDIFYDGLFMKFYRKLNKWFPKGGKKREAIKKLVSLFVH